MRFPHSHRATTAIYFSKIFFPKGAFLTACTFSLQAHSSIRKDCGFVLVANPDIVPKPARGRCRTVVPAALLVGQTLPFGAIAG